MLFLEEVDILKPHLDDECRKFSIIFLVITLSLVTHFRQVQLAPLVLNQIYLRFIRVSGGIGLSSTSRSP